MIQGTNISRPDSSNSQLQRKSIGTCMRSYYSTYIKPPLNPSKRSRSEMRRENQTIDQTTMEKRGN
jgi:hypothetical protein